MTDSAAAEAFWPKQMIPPTLENYKELAKDGAERLAAVSLEQILPAIPVGAIIHDNGCGAGAATATIMASVSPEVATSIKITGTDLSEDAVEAYRARAASSSWPAEGLVMDADSLSFPDQTFTHSIGNAMIFVGPRNNGIDAAKEMYRTLKPGGTLMVNCFAHVPVLEPIREASRATRPAGILPAWDSFASWTDPTVIANIVEAGGFAKGAVSVQQREMFVNIGDFDRHARLVWSMRGMPSVGWSKEDEERWDEAVEIVKPISLQAAVSHEPETRARPIPRIAKSTEDCVAEVFQSRFIPDMRDFFIGRIRRDLRLQEPSIGLLNIQQENFRLLSFERFDDLITTINATLGGKRVHSAKGIIRDQIRQDRYAEQIIRALQSEDERSERLQGSCKMAWLADLRRLFEEKYDREEPEADAERW
ncbi:hypothetical protein TARUN_5782 [Trichoderma arundinaceum]|uniref:Methyltransferase domain-containing protein n=1 Tax=Trichoderma arundinaceum TaxID=490622 RepID=A0A395NK14_TRIAR|nr:hypothetical protein TARUN_5782 [Trichoderma arundinaceum]